MNIVSLIPAAGSGERLGKGENKSFVKLYGIPILARTLLIFEKCVQIDEIIVIIKKEEILRCSEEIIKPYNIKKVSKIIAGGKKRQDSVKNGLLTIENNVDIVIIHDGARPFLSQKLLKKLIDSSSLNPAQIVATKVKNTIKTVSLNKNKIRTLDRNTLWHAQTPQIFSKDLIINAYTKAYQDNFFSTDDSALVERLGENIKIIEGETTNIKITTPLDLLIGEIILKQTN